MRHDSSISIALGYGLDNQGSKVWFLAGAGNFSLHHHIQNSSGAHPASFPVGTRVLSLGIKRLGREADHSPPSSAKVKECVELYFHSPNMPSWHGAQLKKHRDNFTFYLYFSLMYSHVGKIHGVTHKVFYFHSQWTFISVVKNSAFSSLIQFTYTVNFRALILLTLLCGNSL
jgi:hypothetical protein